MCSMTTSNENLLEGLSSHSLKEKQKKKKKKIVILGDYEKKWMKHVCLEQQYLSLIRWDEIDFYSYYDSEITEDILFERLYDANCVILIRDRIPLQESIISRLSCLEYVIFTGARNNTLDISALHKKGIPVSCTRGGPSKESTTELTWALILTAYKRIREQSSLLQTTGLWRNENSVLPILSGERLGLIGLGSIGTLVARVGLAFGMDVVCLSPNMTPERAAEHSVRSVSLAELFETSRIISLHIVSSSTTKNIINKETLSRMRNDAILINTSRSSLINHEDLLEALNHNQISMCGLDVHDEEPLPNADVFPLLAHPRALLTPHLGFVCEPVFNIHRDDVCESLTAYLNGLPFVRTVNP